MNERCADSELLRAFARDGDQRALAEVIRRHLDLVYGTALRKVADAGAAEEISQNVFTVLARKAWQFAPDSSLPAWLHKTTLLESKSWLRCEVRRRQRERAAVELSTTMKIPDQQSTFGALMPLLEEALLSLREPDRTALLLRYYENQSLREVGAALGVNEDVAQKRVASALQRLAAFFQRCGFKTATLATTAAALKEAAVSASAATTSRVTQAALRTAAPTFAGLLALLALLISLTRVQKTTVIVGLVAILGLWLWIGSQPDDKADAQFSTAEASVVSIRPSEGLHRKASAQIEGLVSLPEQVVEAPGRYVEISGEVEATSHPGSETAQLVTGRTFRFSFVCITGTNEWWIENTTTGESKWHFDGTSVYMSLRATQQESEETKDKPKSNPGIHIWPSLDGHPLGEAAVNIPWLAFCSGPYLRRDGRIVPLPCETLHHTPDRFAYSDKTETFADEFGLPRAVELFTSKSLYQTSVEDFAKEWFSGHRHAEYYKNVVSNLQEGVLTFHYEVIESTNVHGWNFPTKFEYFQIGRKYVQNGDWFCRGVGKVKSIRESTKPRNLFVPTTQQTIVDWRFRDATSQVDALTYISTNAFASPTNDPALQERFAKKIGRMNRRP